MASFISANDEAWFSESATQWFDTFKRLITVHKEPIKKIKNNTNTQLFGYGQNGQATSQQIEYIPRSQDFYAVVKYNNNQDLNLIADINAYVASQNYVTMIVDSTAKDYITKEKTEKIAFDGKSFNVISNGTVKYYFTKQYYEFIIKEIT
jgi:hypothetical protein